MAKFPFMSNDEKRFYYFSINATYLKKRFWRLMGYTARDLH